MVYKIQYIMNSKNKGNRFERKIAGFLRNGPGLSLKEIGQARELGIRIRILLQTLPVPMKDMPIDVRYPLSVKITKRLSLNIYCLVTKVVIYSNSGNKLLRMQREVIKYPFFV